MASIGMSASLDSVLHVATQIAQLSCIYPCDAQVPQKTQKQYLQDVSALIEALACMKQTVTLETELSRLSVSRLPSSDDGILAEGY
ncbi:uncharacterized protein ACLA_063380 [Aspergillus clavatus NRRL 1]|uniref:Uncharacterized protein n=1 Tax=Aspergillus clavatus (strain ATCC 1007 / CBS 513.65 / DSM 816 / NCTC 3887 / NRRL 1 / QM 1276 / 107) TaxID=344612 RepID=A1CCW4_ASPCL|nr:uncharacterized protein ACLA_063380 [Aspergillus clavatus NRRL 1]EAW12371.1 hypothetical protein ACLA_063380 [Aspergillus clavatus NRRL 1]